MPLITLVYLRGVHARIEPSRLELFDHVVDLALRPHGSSYAVLVVAVVEVVAVKLDGDAALVSKVALEELGDLKYIIELQCTPDIRTAAKKPVVISGLFIYPECFV